MRLSPIPPKGTVYRTLLGTVYLLRRYSVPFLLSCFLYSSEAQETVHLLNGQFQRGRIVGQNDEAITFEFTRSGSAQKSRVQIPWTKISRVEFPSSIKQIDAMSNPESTPISVFAKLWQNFEPFLSRPESPTARIGLVYAKKLVDSGVEMAPEQALDLYNEIAENAWSAEDQAAAIRGRLYTLFSLNREREAIREAEALAEKTENPQHLLEAKYVLASNAFKKLKEIEEDNPRWHLDDDVRPDRNRYYNLAIDHSLYPFLFYGSEESASARGLLLACDIYTTAKDYKNATICAEDILRLYPTTEFATLAKEKLTALSKLKSE